MAPPRFAFVVHIWMESEHPESLRGSVQLAGSGRIHYFGALPALVGLIRALMALPGQPREGEAGKEIAAVKGEPREPTD